jgi:riboflavin kinase/FMN adenylyltransferase
MDNGQWTMDNQRENSLSIDYFPLSISHLPLRFTGRVIRGAGRGRIIGTPTINLDLHDVPATLEQGIYACLIDIPGSDQNEWKAAVHFGPRPVFDDDVAFEVHLLDTKLPEPPPSLHVHVIAYLRDVRNFPSVEALQAQIFEDIRQTRDILHNL